MKNILTTINEVNMNFKQYEDLVDKLNQYNYEYHTQDSPTISDEDYDLLFNQISKFEEDNSNLILPYSPTQKVGSDIANEFENVPHEVALLSLQNTYNIDDLVSFDNSIKKELSTQFQENLNGYSLEYKIDGLSVAIKYIDGIFHSALTRGNGTIGENVSENVKTIKSLPLKLNKKINIIVRGEVYLPKKEFEHLNKIQENLGENTFANPRNAAAGSLRQKNSKITASRNLDIFIFDILKSELQEDSHYKSLQLLKELGFKTVQSFKTPDINSAFSLIEKSEAIRAQLEYDIDGMVVKVDSIVLQNILGNRTRTPKWAVAYKFKAQKERTKILEITTRVGRSGAITPRARFIPVNVAGSTIEYATLHNQDYIDELDIRIGDIVEIEKAGDVIPKVVRSIKEERDGTELIFKLPEYCPTCSTKTVRIDGESALRCPNPKCPAKDLRSLIHFVSKNAMDIDGLGEAVVTQLVDNGLVCDISDFYILKDEIPTLLTLEKMGDKKIENLLSSIEKSKSNSLEKLITGLGIQLVGEKAAKILAKHFKSLYSLLNATSIELTSIDEIGDKMSESIIDFFANDDNKNLINNLKKYGLNFDYISDVKLGDNQVFAGEIVVLTGKLEKYSRNEAAKIIENLGGKTSSSVSSKTTILLSGESSGSKYKKAQELGIKIIDENDFINMIQ